MKCWSSAKVLISCLVTTFSYKKNTVCNYFIVILEGHVTVQVGDEGMEFDKGPLGWGRC